MSGKLLLVLILGIWAIMEFLGYLVTERYSTIPIIKDLRKDILIAGIGAVIVTVFLAFQ